MQFEKHVPEVSKAERRWSDMSKASRAERCNSDFTKASRRNSDMLKNERRNSGMSKASRRNSNLTMLSEQDLSTEARVLLYPRAQISISLDIPRSKSMFVIVKTKVLDEVFELGRTDSHETLGYEPIKFDKTIEITYFSGVDDNQMAIFEIMDGDLMSSSAFGYIFATVVIPVGKLFKGYNKCSISRGTEHLGFLLLKTDLDVVAEKMNVDGDKKAIAFFQSHAPNGDAVRALHPSYISPLGIYSIELKCRDICNESEELMTSSCYVFVRASLNVAKFEIPTCDMKFLPAGAANMKVLWKSLKNYKKPYDINALEIRFSHTELTGEPLFQTVLEGNTQRKLKLIIEVFVGGTEGDSAPPIRTGFVSYSVYKLLDAAGYPKTTVEHEKSHEHKHPWSKLIPREFICVAQLRHDEEIVSSEEEGFFKKIFSSKINKNEDETDEELSEKKNVRNRFGQHRKVNIGGSVGHSVVNSRAGSITGTHNTNTNTPLSTPPPPPLNEMDKNGKNEKMNNKTEEGDEVDEKKHKKRFMALWYSRKVPGPVKGHGEVTHFDGKIMPQSEKNVEKEKRSMGQSMAMIFSRHVSLTKSKKDQFEYEMKVKEEELAANKEDEEIMNGTRRNRTDLTNRRGSLNTNDVQNMNRKGSTFYNNLKSNPNGELLGESDDKGEKEDKGEETEKGEKGHGSVAGRSHNNIIPLEVAIIEPSVQTKTIKKKRKKIVINPEFEREMVAATTYRDPEMERMQFAAQARRKMRGSDSSSSSSSSEGTSEDLDDGEAPKKKKMPIVIFKKKKNSHASDNSHSSDSEGGSQIPFHSQKRKISNVTNASQSHASHASHSSKKESQKNSVKDSAKSVKSAKSGFFSSKHSIMSSKHSEKKVESAGTANVRVRVLPTSMTFQPGDAVYDDKMAELFEIEYATWLVESKKSFQAAITRQSKINKDSLYLLEAVENGRTIEPYFIVDCHAPSVQGLFYSLSDKKAVATSSTFAGSAVLNGMKDVFRTIHFYVKDGEFRALAGGGVMTPMPPSVRPPKEGKVKEKYEDGEDIEEDDKHYYGHPSAGLPRNIAFPLCQEYLLAHLKNTVQVANAPLSRSHHHHHKKSHYGHHHFHNDHRRSITATAALNTADVAYAVPLSKDAAVLKWTEHKILKKYDAKKLLHLYLRKVADSSGYWGGPQYIRDAVYSDVAALHRGFVDASTLYCPSLVPEKGGKSEYNSAKNTDDEEEHISKQESARNRIRAVRSGINTGVNKSGSEFWNSIPADLMRRTPYNADVETIELLLAQASMKRTGLTLNLVVWILGVCPPPEAIEKASRLFERQAKCRDETALLIILASETEVELDEESESTLLRIGSPFKPLIDCYTEAVSRAVGRRGDREGNDDDDEDEFYGSKHRRHGKKSPATSRMMMQHWMSWQEVLAQAYSYEDKLIHHNKRGHGEDKKLVKKKSKFGKFASLMSKKEKKTAATVVSTDEQQAKEKDEYPTHLSIRHIFTDRSFVGLSHSAADRVLGTTPAARKKAQVHDDDHAVEKKHKGIFKLFHSKNKSGKSDTTIATPVGSRKGSVATIDSRTHTDNSKAITTLTQTSRFGESKPPKHPMPSGSEHSKSPHSNNRTDDDTLDSNFHSKAQKSQTSTFYKAFRHRKEQNRKKLEKHDDLSHLDTTDKEERQRQKDEHHKESVHDRLLAQQRIDGYTELMAVKDRFEIERQLVQRAEIKKFLCGVFLDMDAITQEKKSDKGILEIIGDIFFTNASDDQTLADSHNHKNKGNHNNNNNNNKNNDSNEDIKDKEDPRFNDSQDTIAVDSLGGDSVKAEEASACTIF